MACVLAAFLQKISSTFEFKTLRKSFLIADAGRWPSYMLATNTLSGGQPLQLAAGKYKYYSISFEEVF